MDTSVSVASFSVNQSSQQNKYGTQRAYFCQQALNIGTESIMNNLLQNQIAEKYNCEKCRFSTKDPNKYRNHVSLHNDIKYTCSHCEFVSYTKTEFQRHLVTHTGKFPFTCGYCGYGAIRNDYIVKHIRRIHGDGKILCSVSTLENESKKASINIIQTQVNTPNVQNVLQNRTTSSTEDVIDLTSEVDSLCSSSHAFSPIRNIIADNVEVEVISPVNQQLYPWIPLTVTAPTSFKVPPDCVAEVIEVKSVNSACHLVLKCLNLIKPSVPNQPIHSDHTYDHKPLNLNIPSKNIIENTSAPLLQECAVLRDESPKKKLTSKTVCEVQENLQSSETCPIDKTSEIMNVVEDFANEICDDLDEFSGGPIISSVFSLSSGSQNTIEGINWDCPNTNSSNVDVRSTHLFSKPPSSQELLAVCSSQSNCQIDIEKSDSQNSIEGINWDCPNKSPSKGVNSSLCSSKPPSSEPASVCGSQSNCQMDIDKSDSQNAIVGINWNCLNKNPLKDVNSMLSSSKLPSSEPASVCGSQSNCQMDIDKSDSQNAILDINWDCLNKNPSKDVNSTLSSSKLASSEPVSVWGSQSNCQMDMDKPDSQNAIVGINWDCLNKNPSKDVNSTLSSSKLPSSEPASVCGSQSNCQMDIDKSDSQNAIEGINWDCPNTSLSNNANSTHYSSKPSSSQEAPAVCSSQSYSQMDIDKSDSQNAVEGISLDCPNKSPSNFVSSTHSSSKPPSSEPPAVCGSQSNCQMGIDKSQDLHENVASKDEKESSEVPMENVQQNVDAEIQLSVKSVSRDVKEPESQLCVLQESMKGERRSSRLGKKEINNFITPQALFLSCDKRIVMQPLSCTMQNDKMTSRVDEVTKKLQVLVRMRNESAKAKVKRLMAPAIKSRFQPKLRTLRLHPVKMDQANHIPSYNQPVVVLNHPDVETIEISYIMKGIRMFRGKVTKITLSKQKCV